MSPVHSPRDTIEAKQFYFATQFFVAEVARLEPRNGHLNGEHCLMTEDSVPDWSR